MMLERCKAIWNVNWSLFYVHVDWKKKRTDETDKSEWDEYVWGKIMADNLILMWC